jgi:hypothetical protein
MLELNESQRKDNLRGLEPNWTQDQLEDETRESNLLWFIEQEIEGVKFDSILFNDEHLNILEDLNEMDLNDGCNIRGHHFRAIAFDMWLHN